MFIDSSLRCCPDNKHREGKFSSVVIGNPPYVTINADNVKYKIKAFESADCGDLFGVCLERAGQIIDSDGKMGFIVPLSLTATQKMEKVRQKCCSILSEYWASYYSASAQPSCLFDGVRHRLMIHIGHVNKAISKNFSFYTTNFFKWLQCERVFLFEKIYYSHPQGLKQVFCKTSDESGIRILKKMESEKKIVNFLYGDHPLYYHNAPVYWGKVFDFIPLFKKGNLPAEQSSHVKTIFATSKYEKYGLIALLNSTLFYWYNWQYSNCRDLSKANIENFPCDLRNFSHEEIYKIARALMKDYLLKKKLYTRVSSGVPTIFDSFYPAESKSIIDQIDQCLATYYGFSERELDFIISYDYKYRIGNEED